MSNKIYNEFEIDKLFSINFFKYALKRGYRRLIIL